MKEHPSFTEFAREFDAVVASTIFGAPVIRAAKQAGIPHLWWIHEGRVAEDYIEADPRMRTALIDAEMIVVPDTRSAQLYQPLTDRPVRVLTYGIPDPRGDAKPRAPRTGEHIEFLLLGTIENRKGQRVFIDAVRLLSREVQARARFRIVGRPHDPGLTAAVRTAAAEIEHLTYEESVPHAEALALIAATDVMVSASLDETGPLILIEALALGTPILSTRVGAVAEHLTEGEAGIFVEPGDAASLAAAMERLVREPALIDRLADNARPAYEKHFAFDRFGGEFVDLLREVLRPKHAGE
jgi:glycosyltransferase involved in cell wall biosynthesis